MSFMHILNVTETLKTGEDANKAGERDKLYLFDMPFDLNIYQNATILPSIKTCICIFHSLKTQVQR